MMSMVYVMALITVVHGNNPQFNIYMFTVSLPYCFLCIPPYVLQNTRQHSISLNLSVGHDTQQFHLLSRCQFWQGNREEYLNTSVLPKLLILELLQSRRRSTPSLRTASPARAIKCTRKGHSVQAKHLRVQSPYVAADLQYTSCVEDLYNTSTAWGNIYSLRSARKIFATSVVQRAHLQQVSCMENIYNKCRGCNKIVPGLLVMKPLSRDRIRRKNAQDSEVVTWMCSIYCVWADAVLVLLRKKKLG